MVRQAAKNKRPATGGNKSSSVAKTFSGSAGETNDNAPVRFVIPPHLKSDDIIKPKTEGQASYWEGLNNLKYEMNFGIGPAGTGKSTLGVAIGILLLARGEIDQLVMSRPAVEAGEKLGFLPGEVDEKIAPYLIPLFSAVTKIANKKFLDYCRDREKILIAPLAFIQGQTFDNAFLMLDEAQNATFDQITQFTTRAGDNTRVLLTGDPTQSFIKGNSLNQFMDAMALDPEGIGIHKLTSADCVRSRLTKRIVQNVERYNAQHPNVLPMMNL